jgi:hypothetical protein
MTKQSLINELRSIETLLIDSQVRSEESNTGKILESIGRLYAIQVKLRHSTAPQCECGLTQAENPACRNHHLSDTARLIAVLNPTDKEGRL